MPLTTVSKVADVRAAVARWRLAGQTVAFVPTMGNLHAGHLSLVELAAQICDRVVVSIFVNPTQFGAGEDFGAYPRTPREDAEKLESTGQVAVLFEPSAPEIYPYGTEDPVRVQLPALANELCGASRPGHFDGVASVVCRLLNIVGPHVLVLGQKDFQQWMLVRRMIADLHVPVELRVGATLREPDGLAMSSRNRYLDAEQRNSAPSLQATLQDVRAALARGDTNFEALEAAARERLASAGFRPDYVAVRRKADLEKPRGGETAQELAVLGAGWLGRARLIDNVLV
jgi:pantoate--beta-alanine ligase